MTKSLAAVCAATFAAAAFIGVPSEASARCVGCGPVPPVYHYRTVNKVLNQTRFRDVRRTNYLHKNRYIYNVTRVQPIVRVHTVTRVHHHTIPVVHNVSVSRVQTLPAQYTYSNSVQNYYHGCGCR